VKRRNQRLEGLTAEYAKYAETDFLPVRLPCIRRIPRSFFLTSLPLVSLLLGVHPPQFCYGGRVFALTALSRMNPADDREDSLFWEALERAKGPEREAYLDQACAGTRRCVAGSEPSSRPMRAPILSWNRK